jgi:hypothetical protein
MTERTVDLRIVHGDPTPEELTALVAVLLAPDDPSSSPAGRPPRSAWSAPASRLRRPIERGPDAWRRSLQF